MYGIAAIFLPFAALALLFLHVLEKLLNVWEKRQCRLIDNTEEDPS